MNKVIEIGNLVADPEARTSNGGKSISNFRIAVQREYANAQGVREADFFNVVAFGTTADFVNSYMVKGRKVAVEGRLQSRSYEAQDGSKRYVTEIIAQRVEALGSPRSADAQAYDGPGEPPPDDGQFHEVDDPDNPF